MTALLLLLTAATPMHPCAKRPVEAAPRISIARHRTDTVQRPQKLNASRDKPPAVAYRETQRAKTTEPPVRRGRGGAIAVDEVGVTRDRVYQRAEWAGAF